MSSIEANGRLIDGLPAVRLAADLPQKLSERLDLFSKEVLSIQYGGKIPSRSDSAILLLVWAMDNYPRPK
jgi:hypothetical protein